MKSVDLEQATGKTILRTVDYLGMGEDIIIVYNDETYTSLHARRCYDDAEIEQNKSLGNHLKVAAGFMTEEEADVIEKQRQEERDRAKLEQERREYERLKKRFEEFKNEVGPSGAR